MKHVFLVLLICCGFLNVRAINCPTLTDQSTSTCSGVPFSYNPVGNNLTGVTYTWSTPSGSGFTGGAAQSTGQSSVAGTLATNSSSDVTATYNITAAKSGCSNVTFNLTVIIHPTPAILAQVDSSCSGAGFNHIPTAGVIPNGTQYTWSAPSGSGFTGGAGQTTGQNSISGTLSTTSPNSINAVYSVTAAAGSCISSPFNLTVSIRPTPAIPAQVDSTCSGAAFIHAPTGGVIPNGTQYTWSAPSGSGFTGGAGQTTGQNNISGTLSTSSPNSINAVYSVTATAGSCISSPFNLTVSIRPTPAIPAQVDTSCSGVGFIHAPTGGVIPNGTQYTWGAPSGSGFTGGAGQTTGQNNVGGTLSTTSPNSVNAVYLVSATAGTCHSLFNLTVTIHPTPILSDQADTVCSGSPIHVTPHGAVAPAVSTFYSWNSPSGTATGGVAGSGQTLTGTLINTTPAPLIEVYTITPSIGTCVGNTFHINMQVNELPLETLVIDSVHTCRTGNLFNFSISPGTVYNAFSWDFVAGSNQITRSTSIPALSSVSFPYYAFGQTLTVTMTTPEGCQRQESGTFNVYPMPDSIFRINGDTLPARQCQDSAITFAQSVTIYTDSSTISWGDGSSIAPGPAAQHYYPIAAQAAALYTVTFTPKNRYGCTNSKIAVVTIYPMPNAAFVQDTTSHHCWATNSYQFTDSSSASYYTLNKWKYDFGDGNSANTANAAHKYTQANSTQSYIVTEIVTTDHGCADTASKGLRVYANPVQSIADTSGTAHGRADTLCGTTATNLVSQVTNGTLPYVSYNWTDDRGNSLATVATLSRPALNVDSSIRYTVVVTDHEGCTDTSRRLLRYFPDPRHSAIEGLDTICSGSQNLPYRIKMPENNAHYAWEVWGTPFSVIGRDTLAEISYTGSTQARGVVIAYATNSPYKCTVIDSLPVTITANTAPQGTVVLNTGPSDPYGTLICSNSATQYIWGYDDTSTLHSTRLNTETQQALLLNAAMPGSSSVHYWVEMISGACISKVYLNSSIPLSIADQADGSFALAAYPNPFMNDILVAVSEALATDCRIEVYDITGRSIYTRVAELSKNSPLHIASATWPAGYYILRVSSATHTRMINLVKE